MKSKWFVICISVLFFGTYFAELNAQNQDTEGEWSDPIPFGIVPVAVANLPDGRLIAWSSQFRDDFNETGDGMTFTQIFDPSTNSTLQETVTDTNHDMFCPGINNLPDGRILAAGGTSSERTSIYDPVTDKWSRAADMNINRGYQGNVTLSDGSVFTLGGSWSEGVAINGGKDAELYSPQSGWVNLPNIQGEDLYTANDLGFEQQGLYRVDNHAWLWAAPDGRIFHAGPGEMMHWIEPDLATGGSVTEAGLRGTDTYSMKGTTVMFDVGRILKVGGAEGYGTEASAGIPAKDNSLIIDINNPNNVTVTPTANTLSLARTMHNSTVLPNGQVLVTGGLSEAEVFTDAGARLEAELYDPVTNAWTTVAGMQVPRTYHSVAILMTDGRVFVGGGGLCNLTYGGECVNHTDAEIYSPPYLFTDGGALAARPSISAPDEADYNSTITVTGSPGITEFSLIRFSSATHSTNNEQRRIPVAFTGGGGNYNVSVPDRNLLPPGYYMLFALDGDGVPSVAETIMVGDALPLATNPNLVLHLEFEDAEGSSTLLDSSGNGNDGLLYDVDDNGATKVPSTDNIPATDNGLFGKAAEFDGAEFQSNTILEVPYDATFDATSSSVTVMAWVNRDELVHNVGILSHDYPALFFGFHNSLYKWEFPTTEGSVNCYAGYSPQGSWVHIAATYDGTTARLFANGIEVCTQTATGGFVINDAPGDASAFTSSGFYEQRDPAGPFLTAAGYNQSGVTDEIDGRIDELKVYNKALGAEEIKAFFDLGSGLAGVPDCPQGTIAAEFKIDDGEWTPGNNVNAPEGSRVYLRAVTAGTYYVTTAQRDFEAPTLRSAADFDQADGYQVDTGVSDPQNDSPERNDGLVDLENQGSFVLTTAAGCATVVNVNVVKQCDPEDILISPEWRIGSGAYESGNPGEDVQITATEGQEVRLSILPNNVGGAGSEQLGFNVTLPRGGFVDDLTGDYVLEAVSLLDAGAYVMTSVEGCSVIITLEVEEIDCSDIKAEWSLNGGGSYSSAPDAEPVTVEAFTGDNIRISMLPNGIDYTVTYGGDPVYTGNTDFVLGIAEIADSGAYTITTQQGCSTTLNLNVTQFDCTADTIRAEWSLDGGGSYESAPDDGNITVAANTGDNVRLSMLPNGVEFTVTYEGGIVYDGSQDFILGVVDPTNSGDYIIDSDQGCTTTLTLNVTDIICDADAIRAEWRLNGTYFSAPDEQPITVPALFGDAFEISMLPNNTTYTITYDGDEVYNGQLDYDLGNLTSEDSGEYTITTVNGCSTILTLEVTCPSGPFTPEYTVDGVANSGEEILTVDAGSTISLSTVEKNVPYTITRPDGSVATGDLDLGAVTTDASGVYIFTSSEGCTASLSIIVISPCVPGTFNPRITIDGELRTEAVAYTVDLGSSIDLSVLQNDQEYTITLPDGNVVNEDYEIESATFDDSGRYVFTSSSNSCTAILDIEVVDPCTPDRFTPQYIVDGVSGTEETTIEVNQGGSVTLLLVQQDVDYTITAPDDTTVNNTLLELDDITPEQSGNYVFTSPKGCERVVSIIVLPVANCSDEDFSVAFSINGTAGSGETGITVDQGSAIVLDIVQDIPFTITAPDGTNTEGRQELGAITLEQAGNYVFSSESGCSAQFSINVAPLAPVDPEAKLEDVRLFPNPTTDGVLSIGLENYMNERLFITFYDIYGKFVFREVVPENHQTVVTMDLYDLSVGTYIVEIRRTAEDENTLKKVIKRR